MIKNVEIIWRREATVINNNNSNTRIAEQYLHCYASTDFVLYSARVGSNKLVSKWDPDDLKSNELFSRSGKTLQTLFG